MIEIPARQEPETTELYYKGNHIATVDYTQFLKIRAQIKQLEITGYTITHNDKSYPIYPNGKIELPNGLFDQQTNLLYELL
jgi:hypothetical protein